MFDNRRLFIAALFGVMVTAVAPVRAQFDLPGPPQPGVAGFDAGQDEQMISVSGQFTAPSAGQPGQLVVTATLKPGWHIYSITQKPGGPTTTRLDVGKSEQYSLTGPFQAITKPTTKWDKAFEMTVELHAGQAVWQAPIELAKGVDPATLKIEGTVFAQLCTDTSCIDPQRYPFTASFTQQAPPPPVASQSPPLDLGSLAAQLVFAFLGGLILNLMPCVLPVISLKVLSFLEQAGESRARVLGLNLWYSGGLMAVFMVLAFLAATTGQAWGEHFTLPWFKVALTGVVFAMALSFLGIWEIPIPGFVGSGRTGELQTREGAGGAFFKGVFATVLATPCSGPLLGPIFAYLLTQPPLVAYCVFGAMGLGMALPYLILGVFPGLMRYLPRPGAWMETVKEVMAFLLLGTAVYLLSTLNSDYVIPTLTLLVGIWFAAWLIGRTPLTVGPQRRALTWVASIFSAGLVGLFAFTFLVYEHKIDWRPFSPEALTKARAEGKTVMVDFSANWCPTCKWNLRFAIDTAKVKKLVEQNNVVPMLADWTDRSPTIKKTINELGYNSIPLLVIWPAESKDGKPIILTDLLTEDQVLEKLEEAGPSRPPASPSTLTSGPVQGPGRGSAGQSGQ